MTGIEQNPDWIKKIRCGETSRLQFKQRKIHTSSLADELVAFANSKGGILLFGIEDKKGTIEGLSYEEIQEISSQVCSVANELVHPTIYLQTDTLLLEDKMILAVFVEEGISKPYKDSAGVIWVKQGPDKRRITENGEILRLFASSKAFKPDENAVSDSTLEDIDDAKIDAYINKIYDRNRSDFGVPFGTLMQNMQVCTNSGELSFSGLMFFGKNPQRFFPAFCIKAVAFNGNDITSVSYRDSRDLVGTIPEMFDKALAFLDVNLHHVQAGQSFNSLGVLEVSRIALEEIVQNSLCHRDYLIQAPIRLLIFDNRIEIINPGSLLGGLTVEKIKMGSTYQRNPLICAFSTRTMIYRGLGSGILRALTSLEKLEFLDDEALNQFKVVIWRDLDSKGIKGVNKEPEEVNKASNDGVNKASGGVNKASDGVNKASGGVNKESDGVNKEPILESVLQNMVIAAIKNNPRITVVEMAGLLSLSIKNTHKHLKNMQERNIIARIGGRKDGYWSVC